MKKLSKTSGAQAAADGSPQKGKGAAAKFLDKDKKGGGKQADVSDTGVTNMNNQFSSPGQKLQEDSFEKFYNKDLDLDEDQVPVVIYELNESAINFISQESYEKALILLQKAQTMLEQIQASKNPNDEFAFLLTLHNMGLCYQKLGILEECSLCLDACLKHLSAPSVQAYFNDPKNPALHLKMLKYKCKTHMQICALLSQIHKHREAALHANEAIKISHYLIQDCENLCSYFTNELLQNKPLEEVSIISNLQFSLLEKTAVKLLPIFQSILKKIAVEDDLNMNEGGVEITGPAVKRDGVNKKTVRTPRRPKSSKGKKTIQAGDPDMKNLLGYLNQNEWVFSLNIGNIMQIAPFTLQDFMSYTAIQIELSREFVLEKLCFLTVSYFCMGTEFRFLHQQNELLGGTRFLRKDSEYWHGKAVELAIAFLPSESPLVSHILMSYEKHHSPSNMAIPEDQQQDMKVRIVRQVTGIDSSRLQPIIRYHPDAEFRAIKGDIDQFAYGSVFKNNAAQRASPQVNKQKLVCSNCQCNMTSANTSNEQRNHSIFVKLQQQQKSNDANHGDTELVKNGFEPIIEDNEEGNNAVQDYELQDIDHDDDEGDDGSPQAERNNMNEGGPRENTQNTQPSSQQLIDFSKVEINPYPLKKNRRVQSLESNKQAKNQKPQNVNSGSEMLTEKQRTEALLAQTKGHQTNKPSTGGGTSSNDNQNLLLGQERRAKSSLANRTSKDFVKKASKGPAVSGAILNSNQLIFNQINESSSGNMHNGDGKPNNSQPSSLNQTQTQNILSGVNLQDQTQNKRVYQSVNGLDHQQQKQQRQVPKPRSESQQAQHNQQNEPMTKQSQQKMDRQYAQQILQTANPVETAAATSNSQNKNSNASRRLKNAGNHSEIQDPNNLNDQNQGQTHHQKFRSTPSTDKAQTTKNSVIQGARNNYQGMVNNGSSNQKGAAPITDIRAKRQANTLNVEDLPTNDINKNRENNMLSLQRDNQLLMDMAVKNGNGGVLSQQQQQMLSQYQKQQQQQSATSKLQQELINQSLEKDVLSRQQNQINNSLVNRSKGSNSSKNSSSKRKHRKAGSVGATTNSNQTANSQKFQQQPLFKGVASYNSANQQSSSQAAGNAQQQNEQMLMMIKKREKFNNSALVPGNRNKLEESILNQNLSQNFSAHQGSQTQQFTNLNKLYAQKRTTPTSLVGTSSQNNNQGDHQMLANMNHSGYNAKQAHTNKSAKEKNIKFTQQHFPQQQLINNDFQRKMQLDNLKRSAGTGSHQIMMKQQQIEQQSRSKGAVVSGGMPHEDSNLVHSQQNFLQRQQQSQLIENIEGNQSFGQSNFANGKGQYADWQQMGIIKKSGASNSSGQAQASQGIKNFKSRDKIRQT